MPYFMQAIANRISLSAIQHDAQGCSKGSANHGFVAQIDRLKLVGQCPRFCLRWLVMNASNYNVSSEANRRHA
jgi:hypothetical protein